MLPRMMTNVYLSLSDGQHKLAYIRNKWKHGIRWSRREGRKVLDNVKSDNGIEIMIQTSVRCG